MRNVVWITLLSMLILAGRSDSQDSLCCNETKEVPFWSILGGEIDVRNTLCQLTGSFTNGNLNVTAEYDPKNPHTKFESYSISVLPISLECYQVSATVNVTNSLVANKLLDDLSTEMEIQTGSVPKLRKHDVDSVEWQMISASNANYRYSALCVNQPGTTIYNISYDVSLCQKGKTHVAERELATGTSCLFPSLFGKRFADVVAGNLVTPFDDGSFRVRVENSHELSEFTSPWIRVLPVSHRIFQTEAYRDVTEIEAEQQAHKYMDLFEEKFGRKFFLTTCLDAYRIWTMPFGKLNLLTPNEPERYLEVCLMKHKDDADYALFVTGVDNTLKKTLDTEVAQYRANLRDEAQKTEEKAFKFEDMFGAGVGGYQSAEDRMRMKSAAVQHLQGRDTVVYYDSLNPADYSSYHGFKLTGYMVRETSHRICGLVADTAKMTPDAAIELMSKIRQELDFKTHSAGKFEEATTKGGWSWNWLYNDASGHNKVIHIRQIRESPMVCQLQMVASDRRLLWVAPIDEYLHPSDLTFGDDETLVRHRLGWTIATEPLNSGGERYKVEPARDNLFLAGLPIKHVAFKDKKLTAVVYSETNVVDLADAQMYLTEVKGIVDDAVKSIGFKESVLFGRMPSFTSYMWVIEGKDGCSAFVFAFAGKFENVLSVNLMISSNKESVAQYTAANPEITERPLRQFANVKDAVVVIHAGGMAGSGFIARDGKRTYLYTNKHVIQGGAPIVATLLDGKNIRLEAIEVAKNADVARFVVDSNLEGLEFSHDVPNVDDKVSVIGNSDGVGAITELTGKIQAVGPRLLEVSAEFVHGNSGSPVIAETGKVIGVATFGYDGYDPTDKAKRGTRFNGLRRFAIRLEGVEWIQMTIDSFLRSADR